MTGESSSRRDIGENRNEEKKQKKGIGWGMWGGGSYSTYLQPTSIIRGYSTIHHLVDAPNSRTDSYPKVCTLCVLKIHSLVNHLRDM